MSWDDDPFFWPHKVLVRRLIPGGGRGPRLDDHTVELRAETIDQHRLVRTTDNREVVSSTRVTVPIGSGVTVGAQVTVWPGQAAERTALVLAVSHEENGDPDLGDQIVLSLE